MLRLGLQKYKVALKILGTWKPWWNEQGIMTALATHFPTEVAHYFRFVKKRYWTEEKNKVNSYLSLFLVAIYRDFMSLAMTILHAEIL